MNLVEKAISLVIGTKHERDIKRMRPLVEEVNALEPEVQKLSDDGIRERFAAAGERVRAGIQDLPEDPKQRTPIVQKVLDEELVEVFALVREAARRSVQMRHFDVQLMGGIVLHEGRIAEMRTGEGKTLVATLAVSLNALTGRGVHVVTVNDYLARRDADWMGRIYRFLGLTVGCIQNQMNDAERQQAYGADITYGTNNEFGFDYLRDNMKFDVTRMVQRSHVYAIVDEVDSILVDEARTPLIISGPSEISVDLYYRVDTIIPKLTRGEEIQDKHGNKEVTGDFIVDEKAQTATLTEAGMARAEKLLGVDNLYDPSQTDLLHSVNQALRAHALYQRDREYIIKDGEVIIVDEFTGRLMPGRRWSDGLHQAVEAKEKVKIQSENQTLATITLQNYFRMYDKLAGMTGTAETEAAEFEKIYGLDVAVIPTNQEMIRLDHPDLVYRTEKEKFQAVIDEIVECHEKGQPVLVGTVSIEKSERLSKILSKRKVKHVVLNAKYHEREADIVAQAGRLGAVTIATNMAGRGTDIVLGGNPEGLARTEADPGADSEAHAEALERYRRVCAEEKRSVLEAGGLQIIGTERHESRRIDNQLRGRSGRQGDPGASRFFLSFDDDLMRIFASEGVRKMMDRLGMEENVPIESKMVTKSIERAQTQVESRNFEMRKHLLEYDDVMNKQREAVYRLRRRILEGLEGRDYIDRVSEDIVASLVDRLCPEEADPEDWESAALANEYRAYFGLKVDELGVDWDSISRPELEERLVAGARDHYAARVENFGEEEFSRLERFILLDTVDRQWKDHLLALDHLREGIGLRAYGQRNPLVEYKRESFALFEEMWERIEDHVVKFLFHAEPVADLQHRRARVTTTLSHPEAQALQTSHEQHERAANTPVGQPAAPVTVRRQQPKVGRNDPCPCGSGKKYKKCHGAPSAVKG
ncbi:MAG TPA: preprotein translocase subunit SecA [Candidatus Sulfomarinibacteraceae bacterium]|nr:preprotein translocase subunit SecA [Candidatus Sulfomarinibacteraceae bacterium]